MTTKLLKALGITLCLALLTFSLLFFLAWKPAEPGAHRAVREALAEEPWTRTLFGLHSYGDGRADYLRAKYDRIQVEIDYLAGYAPSQPVRDVIRNGVTALTGKTVQVELSDQIPSTASSYTEADLVGLEKRYRGVKTSGHVAALYILVVTTSAEQHSNVGTTLDENGLAVFEDEIASLPTYRSDAAKLEESTIFHEFGHLLGLEHSASGVMAEAVEVDSGSIDPSNYWFSPEDLAKIRALRTQYGS